MCLNLKKGKEIPVAFTTDCNFRRQSFQCIDAWSGACSGSWPF